MTEPRCLFKITEVNVDFVGQQLLQIFSTWKVLSKDLQLFEAKDIILLPVFEKFTFVERNNILRRVWHGLFYVNIFKHCISLSELKNMNGEQLNNLPNKH